MKGYTTKEFAALVPCAPTTLERWESIGIFKAHHRNERNHRVYLKKQLARARQLLQERKSKKTDIETQEHEPIPATEISATITEQVPSDPAAVVPSSEAANLLPEPQEGKKITPSTEQGAPIISSNKSTAIIAQGGGFVQHLENLPDEIFSAPRFFKVNPDKTPAALAWNQPNNQKLCTAINNSLVGFDISGHGRGEEYALIDADHVLIPNTNEFVTELAKSWCLWLIDTLKPCYCERSISGDGLHIIIKPTPEKFKRIVNKDGEGVLYLDKNFDAPSTTRAKIEIFHKQSARYCLLTGNLFETTSRDIPSGDVADHVLETLLTQIKLQYQAEHPTPKKKTADTYKEFPQDIRDLINRINTTIKPADLEAKNLLHRSEHGAPHPTGFICPWCGSGTHANKSGALTWYETPTPHFTCHARSCGGDIIKFLSKVYGIDNHGKDFYTLLKKIADEFAIAYDPKIFEPRTFAAMDVDQDDPTAPRTQDRLPDCPVNLRVPDNFIFANSGIYFIKDAEKQKLIKVANTPIIPTKAFREHGNGITSYEVAIKKKRVWWKATVDGRTLQDPRKVLDLANVSASILEPRLLARFFADILIDPALPETQIYNQPGWQKDGSFIDPCGGINKNGDSYICRRSNIDFDEMFATCGNPDTWKQKFSEIISGDQGSLKRIAIGAPLVAPLLKVLHLPNFWLHLQGPKNFAKTPLLKFATSPFGNPTEGYLLRTFDSSPKNRVAMAVSLNYLPQALDELETLSAKERAELEKSVYDFVSGVDGQKNQKSGDVRKVTQFHGTRISTGESPLLTSTAKGGALKRAITLHVSKPIFTNKEARNLHIFCEEHHGHFRRQWINYISDNAEKIKADFYDALDIIDEKGIICDSTILPADTVDETYQRAIIACAIAFWHFHKCLGLNTDISNAIQDAQHILGTLPTKDEISDVKRGIDALASWVNEHPKNFATYGDKSDHGDSALSFSETSGIIFTDGRVGFFPNAFRRICQDELKLPSYDKFLNELFDENKIDAPSRRSKAKIIWTGNTSKRVYLFKTGTLINIGTETDGEEDANELAREYGF